MSQNLVIDRPDTAVSHHRGDIIVDTSALFNLDYNIPDSNNRGSQNKYQEILPFLAKSGYRIIIPEMVAFEAGEIIGSGFDAGDLFGSNGRFQYKHDMKKLLKNAALPENSVDKKIKNINIISGTGPREINDFCDKVKGILEKYNNEIEQKKDRPEQFNIRSAARKNIMEMRDSQQKGMGDDSIISLLERDYKEEKIGKPVFVLSDDIGLNVRILDFPYAKAVTTRELISSLIQAGLGKNNENPQSGRINNEDVYKEYAKSHPFTQSLIQLKKDMDEGKLQPSIDIPEYRKPSISRYRSGFLRRGREILNKESEGKVRWEFLLPFNATHSPQCG
jgi:hypothetical protein